MFIVSRLLNDETNCFALSGHPLLPHLIPGLARWAFVCRPFGATFVTETRGSHLSACVLDFLYDRPLFIKLKNRAHLSHAELFQPAAQFFAQVGNPGIEISTIWSGGIYGIRQCEVVELFALFDSLEQFISLVFGPYH